MSCLTPRLWVTTNDDLPDDFERFANVAANQARVQPKQKQRVTVVDSLLQQCSGHLAEAPWEQE